MRKVSWKKETFLKLNFWVYQSIKTQKPGILQQKAEVDNLRKVTSIELKPRDREQLNRETENRSQKERVLNDAS